MKQAIAAALAVGIGSPLLAADQVSVAGSVLLLGPTEAPGAVAQLDFTNHPSNGPQDNGVHSLDWQGIAVDVTFGWTGGDDSITVDAGPNHVAVPYALDVPEWEQGTVLIYPRNGEGV